MDNQQVDITSEGNDGIRRVLEAVWSVAAKGGKATHYRIVNLKEETKYYATKISPLDNLASNCREFPDHMISHYTSTVRTKGEDGTPTLILLWHHEDGSTALPYPLDRDQAADFIEGWLKSVDLGPQPDHDGSNGRGWRLFTEAWGHVAGHHYAIIGVQPAWAMYGK